jgi:hypothetical protein
MLDLVLHDGTTVELALMLRERGVPMLFLSGHHRMLPRDMEDVIWMEKPVSFEDLIGALDGLCDQMTVRRRNGTSRFVARPPSDNA